MFSSDDDIECNVEGGPFTLAFDDENSGVLLGQGGDDDRAIIFASDLLQRRLAMKLAPSGSSEVWLETSDGAHKLHDLNDSVDAKVFCAAWPSPPTIFRCECYWHVVPKSVGIGLDSDIKLMVSCFFVVPWVVDFLFGTSVCRNFIGKNAPLWDQALLACGLSVQHLRRSSKSRAAKARRVEGNVPVELVINNEVDFTISTGGLLALFLYMVHHEKKFSKVLQLDGMSKAKMMMGMLANWLFEGEVLAVHLPLCFCTVVVDNGTVDMAEFYGSQERPPRGTKLGGGKVGGKRCDRLANLRAQGELVS